jgi:SpoVK/Ycf46/Vps4 family AAA+-type ATPase
MDVMVRDRNDGKFDIYTFLTEMDGIDPTEGVVFVFTTNEIENLDAAFVRPGRIDLFLIFQAPNKKLRQRFVEAFHPDILQNVDVADIVKRTDEYTFAELEEIRKLFALDLIDGKGINTERTFETFDRHREEFTERSKFGFSKMEDDDTYYGDDEGIPVTWEEFEGLPTSPTPAFLPPHRR